MEPLNSRGGIGQLETRALAAVSLTPFLGTVLGRGTSLAASKRRRIARGARAPWAAAGRSNSFPMGFSKHAASIAGTVHLHDLELFHEEFATDFLRPAWPGAAGREALTVETRSAKLLASRSRNRAQLNCAL